MVHLLRACAVGLAFVITVVIAPAAHGQMPAPLPLPNVDLRATGIVREAVRLPDGSTIVGGTFSTVFDPVLGISIPRVNLAKFAPDGTLDFTWNPGTDGDVHALALDASGALYVGGAFGNVGGVARAKLAKVASTGAGAVEPWSVPVEPTSLVNALAVDAGGAVFVGGAFAQLAGVQRFNLAKLDGVSGGVDPTWNVGTTNAVFDLAIDASGALYAAGQFGAAGGFAREGLAKIATAGAGSVDATWAPAVSGFPQVFSVDVRDGFVYAAGNFGVRKFDATGTGATQWSVGGTFVDVVAAADDASVFVGGTFASIAGQSRSRIAKLTSAGTLVGSWNPGADGAVSELLVAGNDVFAGGAFATIGGQTSLAAAHLDAVTAAVSPRSVESPGVVRAIARGADGSWYVGGTFRRIVVAGALEARGNLLKLTPGGDVDSTWKPAANGAVRAIAADTDGSVFVGGSFTRINGTVPAGLAKLDGTTGALDPLWRPRGALISGINALALDGQGSLYAGGLFQANSEFLFGLEKHTTAGGGTLVWGSGAAPANVSALTVDPAGGWVYAGGTSTVAPRGPPLAKVAAADGQPDPGWNAQVVCNGTVTCVRALRRDAAGRIVAGGAFVSIGGAPRNGLARLDAATGTADAWDPAPDGTVDALAATPDDATVVGGTFTTIAGAARANLASVGGGVPAAADATWNPGASAAVLALSTASPDGVVLVGGAFTGLGGAGRIGIGALPLPGSANEIFEDGFE